MAQNFGGISLEGLLTERFSDRRLVSDSGARFADADAIAARLAYATEIESDASTAFSRCGCPACGSGSDSLTANGSTAFAPGDDPLTSIDWGSQVASTEVTVYFAKDGERFDGVTSQGWSAYEQGQAMAALETYADVSDLSFSVVDSPDDATFKLVTTRSFFYLGYMNPPGERNEGVGVFATNGTGWDDTGGLEQGGYGFITLVHEFGHGLGLAHPHDTGGTSTIMNGVSSPFDDYGDFNLNQGVNTTMSYNDGWRLNPAGVPDSNNYGYQATPMALDVAIIQDKYGADSHNKGNNNYVLPTEDASGTFYSAIWDTGGVDTITHKGGQAALINLTAATIDYSATGGGPISFAVGSFGGFTIAEGVVIENAKGGGGGDQLVGNDADNTLRGRAGNDSIAGGAGKDKLKGGAGDDIFLLASANQADADEIGDFGGRDQIALDGAIYDLATGDLAASRFVVGTEAGDANDRIIYDDATGRLFFDADGSGADDQVLIATLKDTPTVSASDFLVI